MSIRVILDFQFVEGNLTDLIVEIWIDTLSSFSMLLVEASSFIRSLLAYCVPFLCVQSNATWQTTLFPRMPQCHIDPKNLLSLVQTAFLS